MNGLYIHIPYCHSKCAYCDFYSMPRQLSTAEQYVDTLLRELDQRGGCYNNSFSTIYIGGGTPSLLPISELKRLIKGVGERNLSRHKIEEFTIEANPEDVTPEWLDQVLQTGVNRISMGIQSLNDNELSAIGRRHSAADAMTAATLLMEANITVSLDLIYGLPGQSADSWKRSLDSIIQLNPHHLSAYLLSYEPGTRLSAMLARGTATEASEELVTTMYNTLIDRASQAGYEHYEISNFGKPQHHAIHNSRYWNGTPYLGLGASAHSYDGIDRYANISNIKEYLNGKAPIKDDENDINRLNDYIITSLRTASGLDTELVRSRWGETPYASIMLDAQPLIASGQLIKTTNTCGTINLIIPEQEWLISNEIMLALIQDDTGTNY